MVFPLELKMALRKLTKGFTLIEMMVVLFCLSTLILLSLTIRIPILNDEIQMFENTYKMIQLKSMSSYTKLPINHDYDSNVFSLTFNHHGNVNQAQTLIINDQKFVVQLGKGRYEIR